jgi:hypothetical protein
MIEVFLGEDKVAEPNIFLRICTHTQIITISSDLCPPMPTHAIQKLCNVYYPPTPKSWLDWTNKRSFTVAGFSPERLLVSVFPASEKFDSDLELDAGMHKTKRATHDMMGNVGVPFSFHHERILNLTLVSRFTNNAKLTHAHP